MRPRPDDRGELPAVEVPKYLMELLQCGHSPTTVENHLLRHEYGSLPSAGGCIALAFPSEAPNAEAAKLTRRRLRDQQMRQTIRSGIVGTS